MTYVPADLGRLTIERAGGCCKYCLLHQDDSDFSFHIEHIIAVSHGGKTDAPNLAFSCARCNLLKGSNIAAADPDSGDPTFLFHPRRHQWSDHFRLGGTIIEPLTPEGRASVLILRLNEAERLEQREILILLGRFPCRGQT
jgi:HNH endonuclease